MSKRPKSREETPTKGGDSARRHRNHHMSSHRRKFKRPEDAGGGIPRAVTASPHLVFARAHSAARTGRSVRTAQALSAFLGLDRKEPAPPP